MMIGIMTGNAQTLDVLEERNNRVQGSFLSLIFEDGRIWLMSLSTPKPVRNGFRRNARQPKLPTICVVSINASQQRCDFAVRISRTALLELVGTPKPGVVERTFFGFDLTTVEGATPSGTCNQWPSSLLLPFSLAFFDRPHRCLFFVAIRQEPAPKRPSSGQRETVTQTSTFPQ